jgi:anti-sigma factor RsiW
VRPVVCDRSRAWISLRLDGEISQFESVLLDSHLRACTDCRLFAEDVARQTQQLRSASLAPLPGAIAIPRRRWSRRAIEVGTAATAAAAAAVALVIGVGGSPSRPSVPRRPVVSSVTVLDTESRGLPRTAALEREESVGVARGRRALPQL